MQIFCCCTLCESCKLQRNPQPVLYEVLSNMYTHVHSRAGHFVIANAKTYTVHGRASESDTLRIAIEQKGAKSILH